MEFLVVGLGNPGEQYAKTRHNAGFVAVGFLADDLGARYWKNECGAACAHISRHVGSGACMQCSLILAMPQSFMNASGGPVRLLAQKYALPAEKVIVVHDDMDLPPGKIRVRLGGGSAGHKGVSSLIDRLGSPDFIRVRIGIGLPPGKMPGADFVLREMTGEIFDDFKASCARAAAACVCVMEEGLAAAQNRFN